MGSYTITGGERISGKIKVQGSKNSSLPIMAATVLNGQQNILNDIPDIRDIDVMIEILRHLGAVVERNGNLVKIDTSTLRGCRVPENLMRKMRSSIVIMGALLSRFGKAIVSYPGGCEIGPRPIDLHLKGLAQMGVTINKKHGFIYAETDKLVGADIHLDFPSVGATENLILAGVMAEGETIIRNVAKEPEIVDLQNFLSKMGAKIKGAGTDTIKIKGTNIGSLVPVDGYKIIPDRIAAGTYLALAAVTRGEIILENIIIEHLEPILAKLREMGCEIDHNNEKLTLNANTTLKSLDSLRTLPYPGFPTDMQAPMMALLSTVKGTSIITETVFENRFKHAEELKRMGAKISINGNTAIVKGVDKLTGAVVEAKDLRAGAALVIAALAAEGRTTIEGVAHIDRGYEKFEKNLSLLGANIKRSCS